MTYRILISRPANEEILGVLEWLNHETPQYAQAWNKRILAAIASLTAFPLRCPRAIEYQTIHPEARQLFCGKGRHIYRIVYTVVGNEVHILHIHHCARDVHGTLDID